MSRSPAAALLVLGLLPGTAAFAQTTIPWIVRDDFLVTRSERHDLLPDANDTLAYQEKVNATWTIVEMPLNGAIDHDFAGNPRYTADPGFVGTDRLRFRICLQGGECRESDYTIEVVPFAGGLFGAQGTTGRERRAATKLPVMASPRWRATPLVAAERFALATGPDRTPLTPWDSGDGVAFVARTLPAVAGEPVVHRIDVMLSGLTDYQRQDLFVGVDDDGDGTPSAAEIRCTDGEVGDPQCSLRLEVGAAPVTYWVMTHTRLQIDAEADITLFDVPLVDGDGSLVVSGPGRPAPNFSAGLMYAWEDRTMLRGHWRRGYLRMEAEPGVPAGEVVVDVVNDTIDFRNADALPLRPGVAERVALAGGGTDPRIFIDVPAGATRLTVASDAGVGVDVDFYVARHEAPVDPAVVFVDAAPPASAAVAEANGPGGEATVVIDGPALQPGRWYIVPGVPGADAAEFTLTATIEAVAPRVRPGSYFNAARPGSGLFLHPAADQLTGLWYTYFETGRPTWYYLQAPAPGADGLWNAPIWRAAWDGDDRTLTAVGRVTLTPSGPDAFTLSYVLDGETGTQPFAALGRGCPLHDGVPLDASNQWFNPARAGTGYSLQTWPDYEYFAAYVYDALGEPMFLAAELGRWGGDAAVLDLQRLTGAGPTHAAWFQTREEVGTFLRRFAAGSLAAVEIDAVWTEAGEASPSAWSQVDDVVAPLGGEGTSQGCEP